MIADLLVVVSLQLGEEEGEKDVLVLDLEARESELDVFEVAQQYDEELQSWIHGELSEQDWRRGECEA